LAFTKLFNQTIEQINNAADRDRQDSQEKRLSMYLDDYKTEIEALIATQFHKDNQDRLYLMVANYYNLFKKIVNLKSVLYKQEAKRKWYKRDGKTEDDKYSEMIEKTNINSVMPTTNKLTNVNNTSVNRIIADITNKRILYEAIPSENISVIQDPDNPNKIKSLLHRVTIKDSNLNLNVLANNENIKAVAEDDDTLIIRYFYWDEEQYKILDGEMNPIKGNIFPNPYKDPVTKKGIIPYVIYHNMEQVAGNFWNETVGQDLYNGTLQVNVFQTYQNNLMKIAGYRQLFMTGIDNDEQKKLNNKVTDPLQPIVLSDPKGKIEAIPFVTSLKEYQDSIHDIISEIADNHGVEFSSRTSSAQKMSGLAMSISQEQINNIREEQQPLYRVSEMEQARKTVIISNKEFNTAIDVEGKFSIDFYQEEPEVSLKDKMEYDKFLLSKNLKSIIDIYKEIDPDTTSDDDAIKRIEENKKQNDELMDSFPFSPVDKEGNEEEGQEEEEKENEENG